MQSSYQLKLSDKQQELLTQQTGISPEFLEGVIEGNVEQIAYMLQAYYSREKVSKVIVIPGSISFTGIGVATLRLEYVIEEFNSCSAINTEQKEKMTVTIEWDDNIGLNIKGENWPEL